MLGLPPFYGAGLGPRCARVFTIVAGVGCVASARRGQPCVDLSCLPAAQNGQPPESFCLAAVSDAATKKSTNRPLAVVEAREELHTQRRADRDERADEIYGKSERGPVVRDVLGQAVPVVLAAPAHGQAADGAAGT